jgi:hypothetical protein
MAHSFKFSDINKLWHSKPKHLNRKQPAPESAKQTRKKDDWAMSAEDALRITYSGHK